MGADTDTGLGETSASVDRARGKGWLSAVSLLSFVPAFGAARLFTYFLPTVVVEQSGIHFHHFWYGMFLLAGAGWIGLAGPERWTRLGAVMYGLGGGLLADEFGLLLTLGDYRTEITYTLVVGVVATAATSSLVYHYRSEIVMGLRKSGPWERVAVLGLFVLVFPLVLLTFGIPTDAIGLVVAGAYRRKRGGPWRISRRQVPLELAGLGLSVVILLIVGFAGGLLYQILLGAFPPPPSLLIPVLISLLLGDVFSGLIGGWAWSRFILRNHMKTQDSVL